MLQYMKDKNDMVSIDGIPRGSFKKKKIETVSDYPN